MQTNSVMRNIVLQVGWVLLNDSKRYIGLCRNGFAIPLVCYYFTGNDSRFMLGFRYKTKKLIVSRQPIFTNLKSNTMKTLQKYDFIFNGQIFIEKNVLSRCFFVNISDFQS